MEEVGRRTFRIDSCLGRGGFGEVYRALMNSPGGLQSEVAVKVLRGDLDPAGQAVQRLRDEGRLLARLDHPTILRVHDLVLLDGRIALVTEFIDGEDLGALCHGDDALSVRALLEVIGGVAGALDAAWSSPIAPGGAPLQIVHRDIKPSNIRVSRHGQVKLLDFGIARTDTVDREARTQTNLMVGSPAYMAPERFTSNDVVPASDVFALGCALYEGLAGGDRLLGDLSLPMLSALALDASRYAAHVRRKLAPVRRGQPENVVALLVEMLAWDPAGRPTAAAVQRRCEELSDGAPGRSLARWCRERAWPTAPAEVGLLDGRVLSEGTLARSREIAPVGSADVLTERGAPSLPPLSPADSLVAERPPRRGLGVALVGGGIAASILAAVLIVGTGAGLWAWGAFDAGTADPEAEAAPEALSVAPASLEPAAPAGPGDEAPVLVPALAPNADPVPVAPVPVPTPRPVVAASMPRPVAEVLAEPVPAPAAPHAAAPKGVHVDLHGDVAVNLRQGQAVIALPAEVPLGTWEIWALFNGKDEVHYGDIAVDAGSAYSVKCSAAMRKCSSAEVP